MRRALLFSSSAHAVLIAAALFTWDFGGEEPDEFIEFAEVDVLSEDEFNAAISTAPRVEVDQPQEIADVDEIQRQVNEPGALTPVDIAEVDGPADPEAADADPDLSAVRQQNTVTATLQTVAPEAAEEQETALLAPSERAPTPRPDRPQPPRPEAPERPSLNIDTTPAAPPPEDVKVAEEAQEQVAEAEGDVDAPVQEETAPEEAATEIIPEIAEDLPEETAPPEVASAAPLTAARPRARPDRRPEPEPEPQPQQTAEAAPSINDLLAQVQGEATPAPNPALPEGPPITAGEREGLKRAVSQNWNIGNLSGYPSDVDLRLTVAFTLTVEGQVEGDVRLLRPANPDRYQSQAFAAARRAILIASRQGQIRMPAEKYARWREVEITFDPRKEEVGF
ncbi:MAG: hypothetical protein AAFQ51_01225 [Pseudomonadota bacterium]